MKRTQYDFLLFRKQSPSNLIKREDWRRTYSKSIIFLKRESGFINTFYRCFSEFPLTLQLLFFYLDIDNPTYHYPNEKEEGCRVRRNSDYTDASTDLHNRALKAYFKLNKCFNDVKANVKPYIYLTILLNHLCIERRNLGSKFCQEFN